MTLRQLNIPASEWHLQDITTVRNALADVAADPAMTQAWRGSVVLTFVELEEGNAYVNPAIAAYVRNVYSEFPYLLYFLNPDRATGALDGFFASIGALYENDHGVWIDWSEGVAMAFYQTLADAAEFAIERGDDWVGVVKGYEYDERQARFSEIRAILIARGVVPE